MSDSSSAKSAGSPEISELSDIPEPLELPRLSTTPEVELARRGGGQAAVSPDELQELGGFIPVRSEPSPASDYELTHPPATADELRRIAGLPALDEICGSVGPSGQVCRLRRGHNAGEPEILHVSRGHNWTEIVDKTRAVDGSSPDASLARMAVSLERGVELLDRLVKSVEDYVEQTLHTVR